MEAIDAQIFESLASTSAMRRRRWWRGPSGGRDGDAVGDARRRGAGDAGGGACVAVAGVCAAEAAQVAEAAVTGLDQPAPLRPVARLQRASHCGRLGKWGRTSSLEACLCLP